MLADDRRGAKHEAVVLFFYTYEKQKRTADDDKEYPYEQVGIAYSFLKL